MIHIEIVTATNCEFLGILERLIYKRKESHVAKAMRDKKSGGTAN